MGPTFLPRAVRYRTDGSWRTNHRIRVRICRGCAGRRCDAGPSRRGSRALTARLHPGARRVSGSEGGLADGNWLIAGLPLDERTRLISQVEIVSLPLGLVLAEPGDRLQTAWFPNDAVISLVTVMRDGNASEATTIGREGVTGYSAVLADTRTATRMKVQLAGTAARIPFTRLRELCDTGPALRRGILRYVDALLRQSFQMIACNAVHSVETRCCRWVLTIQDRVGRDELALTQEFLASMLGVRRPTVGLALRALSDAGLIATRRGAITVIDRARLEHASCECYRIVRRNMERLLQDGTGR